MALIGLVLASIETPKGFIAVNAAIYYNNIKDFGFSNKGYSTTVGLKPREINYFQLEKAAIPSPFC